MPLPNLPSELHRLFQNKRQTARGFVFLHTLILLLIGCALLASMMDFGIDEATDSKAALTKLRLDAAAESGLHRAVHRLLNGLSIGMAHEPYLEDGFRVDIHVQPSDGLISLKNTDKRHLQALLDATLGVRSSTVFASLSKAGNITSYADLIPLEGVGLEGLACLLPYVTIFSDRTAPVAEHAPARLLGLLNLRQENRTSAMQEPSGSPVGSVIRILARAFDESHQSRILLTELLLTGRTDQPVWVLEWLWLPVIDTNRCYPAQYPTAAPDGRRGSLAP